MMAVHQKTEETYHAYKKLVLKRCNCEKTYAATRSSVNKILEAWEGRASLAQTMIRAVHKKPSKKKGDA